MNKRPKIVADENIPFLQGRLEAEADMTYIDQEEFTPERVRDADALLVRTRTRCGAPLLEGSSVRLAATGTIGMDHFDIPWCQAHGIVTSSAPGCNAPGVAQYVWTALLRLGFDPAKHNRLGVVGCGNIGGIVAAWGRAMGAEIWVSDPPRQRAGIPDNYHSLDDIMTHCDAVTFHTPLTRSGDDKTFHLAGARELAMLRPGAILVNASRGPVVDNAALADRLRDGAPLLTAIDTWEDEPAVNKELLSMVNYGTFHIAGYSYEGKQRATRALLEAVRDHLGLHPDISDLEGPYNPPAGFVPDPEGIMASYDIEGDTRLLRENPDSLDRLRHDYVFRHEYMPWK